MINKNDYKNVYVFAEQRGGVIQPVALELIGKARDLAGALGSKVVAMLAGYNVEHLIQPLFEYGADEVVVTDHIELKDYLTEQYAQSIYQIITAMRPDIVLFGATTIGRDLAPRLSARLATGLTADCTKLEISEDKQLMMTRPAFGGNLMATIMCTEHRPQMSTVRPGVMPKRDPEPGRTGSIVRFETKFDHSKIRVKLLEEVREEKNNSSQEAAEWAARRDLPSCRSLRKSSAPRFPHPGPWSTPASCRTTVRWARPERPYVPTCTSPSVSPVPSSTWPVWRSPASSWP